MWSVPDAPDYTVFCRLLRCHGKILLIQKFNTSVKYLSSLFIILAYFISKKRTPAITFLEVSVIHIKKVILECFFGLDSVCRFQLIPEKNLHKNI